MLPEEKGKDIAKLSTCIMHTLVITLTVAVVGYY
jgi:hypothetical protein